jgi:hypothetical protein
MPSAVTNNMAPSSAPGSRQATVAATLTGTVHHRGRVIGASGAGSGLQFLDGVGGVTEAVPLVAGTETLGMKQACALKAKIRSTAPPLT